MKRKILILLSITLVISSIVIALPTKTNASKLIKKATLNKNNISVYEGKKAIIRLKRVSKKVKWTVKNKRIAKIVKREGKYKNTIIVKGLKKGTTKITAKYRKKTYTVKVKVRLKKGNAIPEETTKFVEIEETKKAEETSTANEISTTPVQGATETTVKQEVSTTSPDAEPSTLGEQQESVQMAIETEKSGIKINITKYIDEELYVDYEFGKLEKYENGEWKNVSYMDSGNIEPIWWLQKGTPYSIYISFNETSGDCWANLEELLVPGHYRYSHPIKSFVNEDIWISDEFDITE